tara:strand:- start:139 stop:450 length:312 start_codon:yes stop_codon:yes gene_type:complete
MKLIQYVLIFFIMVSGTCFAMMKSEAFTEEPRIPKSARLYLKSPEEIDQMSKQNIDELRRKLQHKNVWNDYVKAQGKIDNVKDPLTAQRIRLILLEYKTKKQA